MVDSVDDKPIEYEAIRWPGDTRGPIWIEYLLKIWPDFNGYYASYDVTKRATFSPRILVTNKNGEGVALPGDWIIRTSKGEFHVTSHRAMRSMRALKEDW